MTALAAGKKIDPLLADLDRDGLAGDPDWLAKLRRRAAASFDAHGLPTPKQEAWKYTDLSAIRSRGYRWGGIDAGERARDGGDSIEHTPFVGLDPISIVFVDGVFAERLSDLGVAPRGVRIVSIADALSRGESWVREGLSALAHFEDRSLVALNTAYLRDGAAIYLPERAVVERPIHVRFLSSREAAHHPRMLFCAMKDAEATLIEDYAPGADRPAYYNNAVSELSLGANARLRHIRIENEASAAHHTATVQVLQRAHSRYQGFNISVGASLARIDTNVALNEAGSEAELWGVYSAFGNRHVDNHTFVDHTEPSCTSRETYKGILGERGRAVFNGRVLVRPDAQKTNAVQRNQNLLLSTDARVDTKPELEIYADDVKCAHGATVGQLDPAALFYLRSRGLGVAEARAVLSRAFVSDVLDRIGQETIAKSLALALMPAVEANGKEQA